MSERIIHLRIHGLVQGVAFRHYMTREALKLGIAGWVRNRSDGSVEAVAQGQEEAVRQLADWARHGPRAARVDRVDEQPWTGEVPDGPFQQAPTL